MNIRPVLLALLVLLVAAAPASAQTLLQPGGAGYGYSITNPGHLTLDESQVNYVAPELHFVGTRGHWLIGEDVANHGGGGQDFVVAARRNALTGNTEDIIYLSPYPDGTRVGVGITPPSLPYRFQTGGQGADGGIAILRSNGNSGNPFAVVDSNGTPRAWINADYRMYVPALTVGGHDVNARLDALEARLARAGL